MPVQTDRRERHGRGRALWMLLVPSLLGFSACAKDYCKAQDLPREQLCKCQPKDDELLARLQPTELPYPVRKVLLRCANDLHRTSPPRLVTKQALGECLAADSRLDAQTKQSVAGLIERSTLMDQKDLDTYGTQCQTPAAPSPGTVAPPTSETPAAVPPAAPPSPTTAPPAPASAAKPVP